MLLTCNCWILQFVRNSCVSTWNQNGQVYSICYIEDSQVCDVDGGHSILNEAPRKLPNCSTGMPRSGGRRGEKRKEIKIKI